MSLKLGTQDIAGISQNTKYNAHHLLDFKWSDCIMNDVSWLRADTFSWQSGDVYTSAYNHLVADISGITAETETIGSYTVTFYRATDGHKICLADQEQTVLNIYNESGIAWYYIVDTTNTQFKLPRTKFGFEGLRTNVGDKIDESLPNITGGAYFPQVSSGSGCFTTSNTGYSWSANPDGNARSVLTFDASHSSSTYQDNAPVQERATQMYLYFYVGDYSQTAIEQTAGINSELFNGKADVDLSNCTKPHIVETYVNGTSWYRVYSDGWCEQGSKIVGGTDGMSAVAFLQTYISEPQIYIQRIWRPGGDAGGTTVDRRQITISDPSTSGFNTWTNGWSSIDIYWVAAGYIS